MLGKHIAVNKKKKYYRQSVYYLSNKNIAQNALLLLFIMTFDLLYHLALSQLMQMNIANFWKRILKGKFPLSI